MDVLNEVASGRRPAGVRWWWLWLAVIALSCLPAIVPAILPLTDIGGHLGRFTVQLDAGRTPTLAAWYSFEWHLIPNLGVDLLVQLLGPWLGIEPVVRLAVILTLALTTTGILLLSSQVHGRITAGAILALPLACGMTFHFGFINFNLSLGLALCASWLWLRSEEWPTALRWLCFAAIASVLWVCHLAGWAIFCVIAGSRELTRRLRTDHIVRALSTTALAMSCVLVPLVAGWLLGPHDGQQGATGLFFAWPIKLLGLVRVLRDRWLWFDLATVGIMLAFIAAMWASRKTVIDRSMALASAIMLVAVILIPYQALGSQFADLRLVPVLLILALLATRPGAGFPRELNLALLGCAAILSIGRLAYNTWSVWERGQRELQYLAVLDAIPRNAQLLTFVTSTCDAGKRWEQDWRRHLPGYALHRRGAFANDQWQIPGGQLIRVHNYAVKPYMADPSEWVPVTKCGKTDGIVRIARRVPPAVGHIWVIWDGPPRELANWTIVRRSGESVLYRRK